MKHLSQQTFALGQIVSLELLTGTTCGRRPEWLDKQGQCWAATGSPSWWFSKIFCNFRNNFTDLAQSFLSGWSFCQNWSEQSGTFTKKRSSWHLCWANGSRPLFKPRWRLQPSFVIGLWEEPREECTTSLDLRPNYSIDCETGSSCRKRRGTKRRCVADSV